MADQPTSRLSFRQMPVGSNFNEWGLFLNQFLRALDQAVAGVLTVTMVGETAKTLDSTDFEPNEARSAALKVIGTPGGDVTLTVPAREKLYAVHNALTGGFALTVKTAAEPTGVTIPAGGRSFILVDGTNCQPMMTDMLGERLRQLGDPVATDDAAPAGWVLERIAEAVLGMVSMPRGTATFAGGVLTLDLATGYAFEHAVTEPTTIPLSNVPVSGLVVFTLILHNGGGFTVTFPAGCAFPGAAAPLLTIGGTDELVFRVLDGSVACVPLLNMGAA